MAKPPDKHASPNLSLNCTELSVEACKVIKDFWQVFKDSSVRLKRKKKEKKDANWNVTHFQGLLI